MDVIINSLGKISESYQALIDEIRSRSATRVDWKDEVVASRKKTLTALLTSKAFVDDLIQSSKRYHDSTRSDLIRLHSEFLDGYKTCCNLAFEYIEFVDGFTMGEHETIMNKMKAGIFNQ